LLRDGIGHTAGIELAVEHRGGAVDDLDAGNVGGVVAAEVGVAVTGAEKRRETADCIALEIARGRALGALHARRETDDIEYLGEPVIFEELLGDDVDGHRHLL